MSFVNSCQCTGPGWCERHQVNKTAVWVRLCQTNPRYFLAWEEHRGPGQEDKTLSAKPQPRAPGGPGTELKAILSWWGIREDGKCPCADHARRMDAWGPELCEERMPVILKWLRQESRRRSLPFNRWLAERVVRLAIRRAGARRSLPSSE
jgi:hypothetical protein